MQPAVQEEGMVAGMVAELDRIMAAREHRMGLRPMGTDMDVVGPLLARRANRELRARAAMLTAAPWEATEMDQRMEASRAVLREANRRVARSVAVDRRDRAARQVATAVLATGLAAATAAALADTATRAVVVGLADLLAALVGL
jgi:uncharacterized protein YqgV (UPF0045/DUF77 family)